MFDRTVQFVFILFLGKGSTTASKKGKEPANKTK